ncbi:YggS family pyridoxal phosphate-dependent enzyme [Acidaminococcus sp. NSJ-142]|jgi:pyridoxal phosphate enzyme (YggS family)|uniref:YggS family pyridoxal phosphate-dependent enzyme n=1 Tax=Acidaminococcus TaxID=904 RepID=UPI000CF881E6|nr:MULTISPECIES: YggS family pyridoxal phosphate-dependent enzyme [Acidaminococcus]MCD2435472.1 YggS family pyridoxal phosphate-dependent enzyme [Acidaminococcus hominis]MCH4095255.1 YggS family pyridoxal phosphate-dependent enzyme [Acidaminococcus provencensis]RHK03442.1 YggS family pyridoxal phosphate-dependent enzyme [Acidaminococcus sp. AM05-11]
MLQENLAKVQAKVQEALANRKEKKATGDKVTILAVTKNHPPEIVTEALAAGLTDVGENRVQEAMHKQEVLPPGGVWHLIGHLQTNKAKHAVEHFAIIESVDSEKIMQHLDKEAAALGKVQDVLLQINEAGEEQKSGFAPEEFRAVIPKLGNYPHLRVRGVMVIAQATDQVEETRPVFAAGYQDFLYLKNQLQSPACDTLSMGMTHDYWVAIEEGANEIRVGSALFGARDYSLKF